MNKLVDVMISQSGFVPDQNAPLRVVLDMPEDQDVDDDDLLEGKPPKKSKDGKQTQEDVEKKRQVRLLKNRQSAALSRQKKKDYLETIKKTVQQAEQTQGQLQIQIAKLTTQNWEGKIHIERLEKEILKLMNENNELRTKLKDLGCTIEDRPKTMTELGLLGPTMQQIAIELTSSGSSSLEHDASLMQQLPTIVQYPVLHDHNK